MDTEFWPRFRGWPPLGLSQEQQLTYLTPDLLRDIDGLTPQGDFGLSYQLKVLNAHGLKGVFLVEALFADALGLEPLRRIVQMIQEAGQEVQIHLHPEWLPWVSPPILPGRRGENVMDFSEDEQTLLIARGIENLKKAGAGDVCAFRAGNYGANFQTLRALARNGILYDTSYNYCYLDSWCGMQTDEPWLHPRDRDHVSELPVSYFRAWAGPYRHAQITACSSDEMESALLHAWNESWYSFVIVSHSFELVRRERGQQPRADRIAIRRFERLCRFLDSQREKFDTSFFSELDPEEVRSAAATARPARPSQVPTQYTLRRFAEQALRKVW